MAQPGDVRLEPKESIYFNSPFDVKPQNTNIRIKNMGDKKIGWAFKSTNVTRFSVTPSSGVLEPGKKQVLDVICETFKDQISSPDRMTIEWVNSPNSSDAVSREWFQKTENVRRQALAVHYNI